MAKISPCFKKIFIFFNSLFAIFGIIVFVLGLFLHQYVEEANGLYSVIGLYVIGSVIFIFSVLGAYGAHKESKCALIVFFVLMCLATAGMLRIAIQVAITHKEVISNIDEIVEKEIGVPLAKEKEHLLNPIQVYFQCCGIRNGYKDWNDQIPESCNCIKLDDQDDICESVTIKKTYQNIYLSRQPEIRRIWSKPCGPALAEFVEIFMITMMAVCFSLAALAILGGVMSLAMIIRITTPAPPKMLPSLPLSYQPPKYSEVVNY